MFPYPFHRLEARSPRARIPLTYGTGRAQRCCTNCTEPHFQRLHRVHYTTGSVEIRFDLYFFAELKNTVNPPPFLI